MVFSLPRVLPMTSVFWQPLFTKWNSWWTPISGGVSFWPYSSTLEKLSFGAPFFLEVSPSLSIWGPGRST
jgi:hypothetical protein